MERSRQIYSSVGEKLIFLFLFYFILFRFIIRENLFEGKKNKELDTTRIRLEDQPRDTLENSAGKIKKVELSADCCLDRGLRMTFLDGNQKRRCPFRKFTVDSTRVFREIIDTPGIIFWICINKFRLNNFVRFLGKKNCRERCYSFNSISTFHSIPYLGAT